MTTDWEPSSWWRVIAPNGSLIYQTKSLVKATTRMKEGDILERLYVRVEEKWVFQEVYRREQDS